MTIAPTAEDWSQTGVLPMTPVMAGAGGEASLTVDRAGLRCGGLDGDKNGDGVVQVAGLVIGREVA